MRLLFNCTVLNDWKKTSKISNLFIKNLDGLCADHFQVGHMNDILFVEDLLTFNSSDIVDGNIIGELAGRSVQKKETTVELQRHNKHICYMSKISAVFQSFHCPNRDTFFNGTFKLEQHLTTCGEGVKKTYPRNVNQIQKSLFEKLDHLVLSTQVNENSSNT